MVTSEVHISNDFFCSDQCTRKKLGSNLVVWWISEDHNYFRFPIAQAFEILLYKSFPFVFESIGSLQKVTVWIRSINFMVMNLHNCNS